MSEHSNNRDAGEVNGTVKYIDEHGEVVQAEFEWVARKANWVVAEVDGVKLSVPRRRVLVVREAMSDD